MTATIHQGEAVVDSASMSVLRKYGIPANGSADISALVAEIKSLKEVVREQGLALVRVSQSGFGQLVDQRTEANKNSKTIAQKTRLAAATPKRMAA
jgi:hypothetical protein